MKEPRFVVVRGVDQDGHAVEETLDMERPGLKGLVAFLEQRHSAIAAEAAEVGGVRTLLAIQVAAAGFVEEHVKLDEPN